MRQTPVDLPLDGPAEADLEPLVAAVEQGLQTLTASLRGRDALRIEQSASALHRAMGDAVQACVQAARMGLLPETLRRRLASASAQLARQRESLWRATAALDRAIDVLMPGAQPAGRIYRANGLAEPLRRPGGLSA